jgi:hypothetical protein
MRRLRSAALVVVGLLLLGWVVWRSIALRSPSARPANAEEVNIYLVRIARYNSTQAILESTMHSASYLEEVVSIVEGLEPPPDLAEAHTLLVEGYRFILDGRRVLDARPRGEERAEGMFMLDWGFSRLWEHQRLVMEYLTEQQMESTPCSELSD